VQITSERAEQGSDARAASVQARQDFWENLVGFRLPWIRASIYAGVESNDIWTYCHLSIYQPCMRGGRFI
jgi:hypothetical protein